MKSSEGGEAPSSCPASTIESSELLALVVAIVLTLVFEPALTGTVTVFPTVDECSPCVGA